MDSTEKAARALGEAGNALRRYGRRALEQIQAELQWAADLREPILEQLRSGLQRVAQIQVPILDDQPPVEVEPIDWSSILDAAGSNDDDPQGGYEYTWTGSKYENIWFDE